MRDTHQGMPEIINTLEQQGQYFGIIRIEIAGAYKTFQFGVTRSGHTALRRVLQLRPFDKLPGLKQRYFFANSYSKNGEGSEHQAHFRVEQGKDGKQIEIRVPEDLLSNLIWFARIQDFSEAVHLQEILEQEILER